MYLTSRNEMYRAFGVNISSDIHLCELDEVDNGEMTPDLFITKEDLFSLWQKHEEADPYYYIKENFCMVRVPDVAIFKIEAGKMISYSPIGKANEDQIRLYLLGTCLGVALMQRKVLPLHGSCIAIDGNAYAFVGDSGAGKSTLASAFINRGYQMLTDDVIAVTQSIDNCPYVNPSYPQQKLWQESLDYFGVESNQFKPIFSRETKFAIPLTNQFVDQPMPLAGIFVLSKADQHKIEFIPIQKLARLPILYQNTYRNFMIHRLGLMEWHFKFTASIVNKLEFQQIIRPTSRFTVNEIVDHTLQVIKGNEQRTNNNLYQEGVKVL